MRRISAAGRTGGWKITARIHPTAVVEHGAEIGSDVEIGPFCVVGSAVRVGDGSRLLNSVTVTGSTAIGRRNVIYPYTVLGAPPQDLKYKGGDTRLVIGDDNVIREHVTMNVATEKGGGVTTVGSGGLFMCACHIAHDCLVGDRCIISNQVLLAGHVHIGEAAVLSGAVAIHHFVTVGEYSFIGGMSRIVQDVPPFLITEGDPGEARSLNVVGLRRNGFSDEAISALEAVFKAIFRSGKPMSTTLDSIESGDMTAEVERLVTFLRARADGKHGRALQP